MYTIRKCLRETSFRASSSVTLDPEKFRNLSDPYTGNSEKEFMDYISSLCYDDVCDELDEETSDGLYVIIGDCVETTEYSNSAWKGEDSWFEIGKDNEEWSKTGGFEILHSQLD